MLPIVPRERTFEGLVEMSCGAAEFSATAEVDSLGAASVDGGGFGAKEDAGTGERVGETGLPVFTGAG